MPTDEQRKRERFEAWVGEHIKQWEAPGTTPAEHQENVKHWLVMSDGERFDHHATQDWWTGFRARDAEVQALKEELLNYVSADEMAVGEGYGTYPKSEHRRIRALVAGGEEGEAE